MKLHLLVIVSLLCVCTGSTAAAGPFTCLDRGKLTEQSARVHAEALQHTYSGIEWFTARFEQDSYLAALDMSEQSSGQVWFHNPGEMKWHYQDPEEQVFVLRDRSLWFYQKAQKQVFVDELKSVLFSDLPVAFLMGIGSLNKSFVLLGGCTTEAGVALEFAPKVESTGEGDPLQQLTILVDQTKNLPIGAVVFDPAGNRNRFRFLSVREPKGLVAKSVFAPDWPENTDVIDRRGAADS